MEKAFNLGDELPDSIMSNECHQRIARYVEIIRQISKSTISKLEG